MELIKGDVARSESHTWKDKDEIFIEMAAEQFARLFWKQFLYKQKLDISRSRSPKGLRDKPYPTSNLN
jgi:hypothetical protein